MLASMPFIDCLPDRRRAALLLAVLFVPFLLGSMLAGLIVCPQAEGEATTWNPDCPRRALAKRVALAPLDETPVSVSDCLVMPTPDVGVHVASSPTLTFSDVTLLPSPGTSTRLFVREQVDAGGDRAPPGIAAHLRGLVVMRV